MPKVHKSEIEIKKITVAHTMVDGSNKDSIEGYVIPYNNETAAAYNLLKKIACFKSG